MSTKLRCFEYELGRRQRTACGGRRALAAILVAGLLAGSEGRPADSTCEEPAPRPLQEIAVNCRFDPRRSALSATARLTYSRPAAEQSFFLAKGLRVSNGGETGGLSLRRDAGGMYTASGSPGDTLFFFYSGRISGGDSVFPAAAEAGQWDDFRLLSRGQEYYPSFGCGFLRATLTATLPPGWNALSSGANTETADADGWIAHRFAPAVGRDLPLVCGKFKLQAERPGSPTIRLYGAPALDVAALYDPEEIADAVGFFSERFGPPAAPELHILFQRAGCFGGLSFGGLILCALDPEPSPAALRRLRDESPLPLADVRRDVLVHEIAHQWWGGLVSWSRPADLWITEGLATFSCLLYQRRRLSETDFAALAARLREQAGSGRGVDAPPLAERGGASELLGRQRAVHVRTAVIFWDLCLRLGEAEVCRRLREILRADRHRCLSSAEFIRRFSGGDRGLEDSLAAALLPERSGPADPALPD